MNRLHSVYKSFPFSGENVEHRIPASFGIAIHQRPDILSCCRIDGSGSLQLIVPGIGLLKLSEANFSIAIAGSVPWG